MPAKHACPELYTVMYSCTYIYIHLYIVLRFNIFYYIPEHVLDFLPDAYIETGIENLNFNATRPLQPLTKNHDAQDS